MDLDPEFSKCAPFSKQSRFVQMCHAGFWDPPILLTPTPVLRRPSIRPFSNGDILTVASQQMVAPMYASKTAAPQAAALRATAGPGLDSGVLDPATLVGNAQQLQPDSAVQTSAPTALSSSQRKSIILQLNGKPVTAEYRIFENGRAALNLNGVPWCQMVRE
jgi:hypothetical protein